MEERMIGKIIVKSFGIEPTILENGSIMKARIYPVVAALLAMSCIGAFAEDAMVKGVVKKIDGAAAKITLTSGPIKSLDMNDDNMTMVYKVQDPALLKQVNVGDKVQFQADSVNGQILVTKLEKAK
jgi:Cu(I)/Ag(I) efflux system periplasmic protein CusF